MKRWRFYDDICKFAAQRKGRDGRATTASFHDGLQCENIKLYELEDYITDLLSEMTAGFE